jgi:HPr kinase/phosphorylase
MVLTVQDLCNDYKFKIMAGEKGITNLLEIPQVSRPGIELAGLFDFYESTRIQVIGSKEVTFLSWLNDKEKIERVDKLFKAKPPVFIFSLNGEIPDIFIEKGNEYDIPILKARKTSSELISSLFQYLNSKMSDRISLHGTLVDISGVGVLIRGESGLGKSEVALELVRRGHQLVADDRVDVYQRELGIVVGEAPDLLKEHLEIRGIGIVNIVKLFGAKAYKENKKVMLVVDLERWDPKKDYDRLGITDEKIQVFDTEVHLVRIPVSPGRNVASLVEVAAMNSRLKFLGTDSAKEFVEKIDAHIKQKSKEK